MIENDLPFKRSMASALMKIARHPDIIRDENRKLLPSTWSALYKLSFLTQEAFADAKNKGLITQDTTISGAAAIARAYRTPEGGVVERDTKSSTSHPTPKQAREIARKTKRLILASDGKLYSGATEEEEHEHASRREVTYGIIDAIKTIADVGMTPKQWLDQSEKHWLRTFQLGAVEDAIDWLRDLKKSYDKEEDIIDGEQTLTTTH